MRFNNTYILIFLACIPFISFAQQPNAEKLFSTAEIENLFLKNNMQLLAAKYEIDKAQAEILQAKVWTNPSLEISEVNLWSNDPIRSAMYAIPILSCAAILRKPIPHLPFQVP